jgi:hypothetical protein
VCPGAGVRMGTRGVTGEDCTRGRERGSVAAVRLRRRQRRASVRECKRQCEYALTGAKLASEKHLVLLVGGFLYRPFVSAPLSGTRYRLRQRRTPSSTDSPT